MKKIILIIALMLIAISSFSQTKPTDGVPFVKQTQINKIDSTCNFENNTILNILGQKVEGKIKPGIYIIVVINNSGIIRKTFVKNKN